MENINKIAGPLIEAWAQETFSEILSTAQNTFQLVGVQAMKRLHFSDILLQFSRKRASGISIAAHVDVKATAIDIPTSGRAPNITSFARIRTAYVHDPDLIFIVLSVNHRVYSTKDPTTQFITDIIEAEGFHVYDLKYVAETDLSYNPALGTGQLQLRDIKSVSLVQRTAWEFCQMLDRKYLASQKDLAKWLRLAHAGGWVR